MWWSWQHDQLAATLMAASKKYFESLGFPIELDRSLYHPEDSQAIPTG